MQWSLHFAFIVIFIAELVKTQQCPDLYKQCNNWRESSKKADSEPIWNRWQEARINFIFKVREILLNNTSNWKPHVMYKACLNTAELEKRGLNQLKSVLQHWPLLHNNLGRIPKIVWLNSLLLLHKLGASPFFKIHVSPSVFKPKKYALYIEPGSRLLPEGAESHMREYGIWIYAVANVFGVFRNSLEKQVLDILHLESQLSTLKQTQNEAYTPMTINRLATLIPSINKYLENLFKGMDVEINSSTKILVKNVQYLEKLVKLLEFTDSRTIANYLGWCIYLEMSRDTVQRFRHLSFLIDRSVLGVKKDVSRDDECVQMVMDRISLLLVSQFNLTHETEIFARTIFNDLRREFIFALNNTDWLNESTKSEAMRKIENVRLAVGYPKWVRNFTMLHDYYSDLPVGKNHLSNVLNWKLWKRRKELNLLDKFVNITEWYWNPFDVNAYYGVLQNTIILPLVMLQEPFFVANESMIRNYGAIGSILGHELSHALDTTGRHFNPDRQMKPWWTPEEVIAYNGKIQCFFEQYQNFGVNGGQTLGENIADSVGLSLAYEALRRNIVNISFQEEQDFFNSFAMQWCEISTEEVDFLADEHAPVSYRVFGAVSNLPAFQRAFNCVQQHEVCKLW